jgi:hypothetical protein
LAQNPSGETERVLIAVQNATGINSQTDYLGLVPAFSMQFVDAQTDTPSKSGANNLYIAGWTSARPWWCDSRYSSGRPRNSHLVDF